MLGRIVSQIFARVPVLVGYLAALLAAWFLALIVHVPTRVGRRAVRDTANRVLADFFRGRIVVGEVDSIGWSHGIDASDVRVFDPQGRLIIEADRASADALGAIAFAALGRGQMPPMTVHARVVRLLPDDTGLPSIAATFEPRPAAPPAAGRRTPARPAAAAPRTILFPRLRASIDRVESRMGGVHAEAVQFRGGGRVRTEPIYANFWSTIALIRTERLPPLRFNGRFEFAAPPFRADRAEQPVEIEHLGASADFAGEGFRCHLEYEQRGDQAEAHAQGCRLSRAVVEHALGQPVGLDLEVGAIDATNSGRPEWTVAMRARINGQPLEMAGTVSPTDAAADLRVSHVNLQRIRRDLPLTDIDGRIHFERHGPTLTVDTTALRARLVDQDVAIPTATARARLSGSTLIVDDLRSPIGLEANGEVQFGSDGVRAWAAARLQTDDVGGLPLVRNRVRGSIETDVRADVRNNFVELRFGATGRNVRAPGVRIGSGEVDGRFRVVDGRPYVNVDVEATGVHTPVAGPLNVSGWLTGDPTQRLEGRVRATTPTAALARRQRGPTSLDTRFALGVRRDHIDLSASGANVVYNGAAARVDGAVSIPRGRGTPTGRARVVLASGSTTDLRFQGSSLRGNVRALPVDWVSRAAGLPTGLGGTIDGDLDLLADHLGASRGTIRWHGARFPVVGPVDIDVDVGRTREGSRVRAGVWFGRHRTERDVDARSGLRATLEGRVPANLADVRGWVRGTRLLDVHAANLGVEDLTQELRRILRLTGSLGLHARITREGESGALGGVIGFDVRDVVPVADPSFAMAPMLRRLTRRTVGLRPLTVPLRVRGGVCLRVERDDVRLIPVNLRTVAGRELGEPVAAPPSDCTDEATELHEPIVRVGGSAAGSWYTTLAAVLGELSRSNAGLRTFRASASTRARMSNTPFEVTVQVGPLRSDRWPFLPILAVVSPALARPPFDGEIEAGAQAQGSMLGPIVALDAAMHTRGHRMLTAGSQVDIDLNAVLAPRTDGGALLGPVQFDGHASAHLGRRAGTSVLGDGSATATFGFDADLLRFLQRDWLRTVIARQFDITTTPLPLQRLRFARENGIQGTIALTTHAHPPSASMSLTAGTSASGQPPLDASVDLRGVRVRNLSPLNGRFMARVGWDDGAGWELQSCGSIEPATGNVGNCNMDDRLESAGNGALRIAAALPFDGDWRLLRLDAGGLRGVVAGRSFHLEAISPLVETRPILRVGGLFTGRVEWSAQSPWRPDVDLDLRDGLLEIERLGQPLEQIVVRARSDQGAIAIERLEAHIGEGSVTANGRAALGPSVARSDRLADLSLELMAREIPLTQEGNVFALLTSPGRFSNTFYRSGMLGTVTLFARRARIALDDIVPRIEVPSLSSRTLQPLEGHGDVFILGQSRVSSGPSSAAYTVDLEFQTSDPLQVERQGMFSLGVEARDLHVHYDAAGLAVRGRLDSERGQRWFEYLGRRFDLDRVGIQLDGGLRINPTLDIAGHFSSAALGRIDMTVTDRLESPSIHFRSQRDPGLSESDVLALLVLGRTQTRNFGEAIAVQEQAANAALNLVPAVARGLLGSMRFRGFDVRPIVDTSRGTLAQGTYGAGVTFLDGRFYIEATYRARQSAGQVMNSGNDVQILGEFQITPILQGAATIAIPTQTAGQTSPFRGSIDIMIAP